VAPTVQLSSSRETRRQTRSASGARDATKPAVTSAGGPVPTTMAFLRVVLSASGLITGIAVPTAVRELLSPCHIGPLKAESAIDLVTAPVGVDNVP